MFRPFLPLLIVVLAFSCSSPEKPDADADTVTNNSSSPVPAPSVYTYKSFEVIDTTGVSHGWGYDIFQDDKRMIHQLVIPGEAGTDGFVSAEEADKVAALVVTKLQSGGGFPTIAHEELVQLGITLKTP